MTEAIPEQVTPLLGWELRMQEVAPGQKVIVVNCHTVIGAVRFYLRPEDIRRWCDDLLMAARKAQEPSLLRPVTGLLSPNGLPLSTANGSVMPPDETIHPSGGYFPDPADNSDADHDNDNEQEQ